MGLFGLVRVWLLGLLAIGIWVAALLMFNEWTDRLPDVRPPIVDDNARQHPPLPPPSFAEKVAAWEPGADLATALLAGVVLLSLVSVGGGRWAAWMLLPHDNDNPRHVREGESRRIPRPDGSELHVEITGNPKGPTLILTHGWGAATTEWCYLRRQLGNRFRLVAWDLPGLGKSKAPRDRNFTLPKLAADLRAVVDEVGGPQVTLLGHSIGGMTTLTFAKLFPDELRKNVAGMILVHTTHTNPLKTTEGSQYKAPLQKIIFEPLAYLTIVFSPLVWVMNVLSYLNGSAHYSNYRQTFSSCGTWGQVDWASQYMLQVWPAHYARGLLGMSKYHATDALNRMDVPALVIAADLDRICKPEASVQIHAGLPQSELVSLSPAGHFGLISSHEEFGHLVASFTDRCHMAPATTLPKPVSLATVART